MITKKWQRKLCIGAVMLAVMLSGCASLPSNVRHKANADFVDSMAARGGIVAVEYFDNGHIKRVFKR